MTTRLQLGSFGRGTRRAVGRSGLVALLLFAACDDDGDDGDAAVAVSVEAGTGPAAGDESKTSPGNSQTRSWSAPSAVLTTDMTWQWQLQGELNVSYDADVYDFDLFDVPTSTIDRVHADGRIVICYFSTAYEDWRADAENFDPEDLGANLDDWDGERWVDIRSATLRDTLLARLDLAVEKGCDGVEPDNVTAYRNDSGFDLSEDDQLDFNRFLANAAHERGLLIGLKNDLEQIPLLVDDFDFAVNEQCVEYDECDAYEPFATAGKPIFGAEYSEAAINDPETTCATARSAGVTTIIVPLDLDDAFRTPCG
jgi:endo-alpha-1,4-polygalactosaminidase (GH114 family)